MLDLYGFILTFLIMFSYAADKPIRFVSFTKVYLVNFYVLTFFFSQTKGLWTEEEVKVATGSADCKVVTNPFRLTSSYATIKV